MKRLIRSGFVASGIMIAAFLLISDSAIAEMKGACRVVAVNYSGMVTSGETKIKRTLQAGDFLYEGDLIEVRQGNSIKIAFDDQEFNVVHIEGDSKIRITTEGFIRLDMEKGKILALLDRLEDNGGRFEVTTPHAVSTVRGTYFQVNATPAMTQTAVFDGSVQVYGRRANGKGLTSSVFIQAGEKTTITDASRKPTEPTFVSEAEFNLVNRIIQAFSYKNRENLSFRGIMDSLIAKKGPQEEVKPSRSTMVGSNNKIRGVSEEKKEETVKSKTGLVLF